MPHLLFYTVMPVSEVGLADSSFQLNAVASGDMKTTVDAAIGELVKAQKFGFNNTELEVVKKEL